MPDAGDNAWLETVDHFEPNSFFSMAATPSVRYLGLKATWTSSSLPWYSPERCSASPPTSWRVTVSSAPPSMRRPHRDVILGHERGSSQRLEQRFLGQLDVVWIALREQ